jgi:hypothetical protein
VSSRFGGTGVSPVRCRLKPAATKPLGGCARRIFVGHRPSYKCWKLPIEKLKKLKFQRRGPKMINIILDTSIFRQDPEGKKIPFRALSTLAQSGFVKINIPYVVYKEFMSYVLKDYFDNFANINKGIKSLLRKRTSLETIKKLEEIIQMLGLIKTDIEIDLDARFRQWMTINNAELLPIKNHHGDKVISSYFAGKKPFAAIKSRNDFPDAFIWEAICDLLETVDFLYVIANDGSIIKACEDIGKIKTYTTLEDFIKSDICHQQLKDFYFEEKLPEILAMLKTKLPVFKERLDHILLEKLPGYIIKDHIIPNDSSEATISGVGEVENLEIDYDETIYFGGGYITIPFSCKIWGYADYYIFKGDYYYMPKEKSLHIYISDHSEDYFYAMEDFEFEVKGSLSISFDITEIKDSGQLMKEIDKIFENGSIDLEDINVSILGSYDNY